MISAGPRQASNSVKGAVAALFAAVLLALWAFGSANLPSYILPTPANVLATTIDFFNSSRNLGHLASTLTVVGTSIALSFFGGAIIAITAHYLSWTRPLINYRFTPFLNSFSAVGWTLLATIWFGVTRTTVIFSISIILLPFAIINLRAGLAALDDELGEMAQSFVRSPPRFFLLIVAPAILPFAVATLRIMFGVAWKVALTAELFGGSSGLGYLLNLARQDYDTRTIFTIIIFIIFTVYCIDRFVFFPIEQRTARRFGVVKR